MKTVHVISHVWNYSRLACLHLSQYVLHPPKSVTAVVTVCFCPEDTETLNVLDYFGKIQVPNVVWHWKPMVKERLMRRAIGRDEVARESQADAVFFSDVDYLFTAGCLDAAVSAMSEYKEPKLFYPRKPVQSISHAHGDSEIAKVTSIGVYDIDPEKYQGIPIAKAIGGCQWILGSTAREKGYLPAGHRYLNPEPVWCRTREDTYARFHWGLDSVALRVSGVTRIRHSTRGRTDIGCRN